MASALAMQPITSYALTSAALVGTSVDYGTGAARENDFDDWDEEF